MSKLILKSLKTYSILLPLIFCFSVVNAEDGKVLTTAINESFMQAIESGNVDPVLVNGQPWTFRTPPPPVDQRTVRSGHPRLLLTPDNLPDIIIKMQDPVYDSYMTKITARANDGKMLENAFLYQLTGDLSRATTAKQALLNYTGDYGEQIIFGYDSMSNKLGPVLVFDWIMDTLTEPEINQIYANVKDNFNYDHQAADPIHSDGNGPGSYPWYWNDVYNRHPEIYLPALAFAIANDGIDDAVVPTMPGLPWISWIILKEVLIQ
ncbi:MAG: hypothetical protein L3J24_07095 [Xanthomonadales bacterium]|nr:hypothetical protein [Xanthomonadales bacterium]